MKNSISQLFDENHSLPNYAVSFNQHKKQKTEKSAVLKEPNNYPGYPGELLTSHAMYQMMAGLIPDLWKACIDLIGTFIQRSSPYSALQFVNVLRDMHKISLEEIDRFKANPETNHVLIQNDLMKVVLIHWEPGKQSNIHGHPSGGCVFKVLHGALEEKRYTADENARFLSVSKCDAGSIAYIDDNMAYHAVGNPFKKSAISIHAYTPGKKS